MSPGGQWYPATSDYGHGLLGTGRLFYDQHYASSGNYVGRDTEDAPAGGWGGGAFSPMEIASGIARTDARPGSGNRQVGLNLLGRLGMFGDDFGATRPETGFGGTYEGPDPDINPVTGAGSGLWT